MLSDELIIDTTTKSNYDVFDSALICNCYIICMAKATLLHIVCCYL